MTRVVYVAPRRAVSRVAYAYPRRAVARLAYRYPRRAFVQRVAYRPGPYYRTAAFRTGRALAHRRVGFRSRGMVGYRQVGFRAGPVHGRMGPVNRGRVY